MTKDADFKAKQRLPELVSVTDTCKQLKVSTTVVRRLVHTGALASQLVGKSIVIGQKSIDDYIAFLEDVLD